MNAPATQSAPSRDADLPDLPTLRKQFADGQLDEAELNCFRWMEQAGASSEMLHLLGQIAVRRGQHQRAVNRFKSAVGLAPDNGLIRAHYADALRLTGVVAEAIEEARAALRLNPEEPEAYNCLGLALLAHDEPGEALEVFIKATELAPRRGGLWNNVGRSLHALHRMPECIDAHRRAVTCNSSNLNFLRNLIEVLLEDLQHSEAIDWLRRVIDIEETAEIWNRLGQVYNELGDADEAIRCFRRAIEVNPDVVAPFVNLAVHFPKHLHNDDQESMTRLLYNSTLNGSQEAALRFALAAMHDRAGNFESATNEFRQGNHVQREWHRSRSEGYSSKAHEGFVDGLLSTFTRELLDRTRDWGSDSVRPVFIVGLPRSGTTLTEQILGAHPGCLSGRRTPHNRRSVWQVVRPAGRSSAAL